MIFRDRTEAGQHLAKHLMAYAGSDNVLVLGLPRGGVPVAYEVAQALHVPLDVCLVRKLGVPDQPELAMGAIADGGVRVLNPEVVGMLGITREEIEAMAAAEMAELKRRAREYRGPHRPPEIAGWTVILVDDGLATGSTMRAALAALRLQHPARLIAAVPVGAPQSCAEFKSDADEVVCAETPSPFYAVGQWYEDFSATTDDEVRRLLAESRQHSPVGAR
jgi:putative phosphoribosyl transferase